MRKYSNMAELEAQDQCEAAYEAHGAEVYGKCRAVGMACKDAACDALFVEYSKALVSNKELTFEEFKKSGTNSTLISLQGKKTSIGYIQMGIASVGMIGGWVYANKTGGGFWRYVGFGILGSIAAGSIGYFTTMQQINKINEQIEQLKLKAKG